MAEDFKTSSWDNLQYRRHSDERLSEVAKKIKAANDRIVALLSHVFETDAGRTAALRLALGNRYTAHQFVEILERSPKRFGRRVPGAERAITGLVREVRYRADLLASSQEYDRLHTMTFETGRTPETLRQEYDYCEENLRTRETRYGGAGGPDDPGSLGAMKVSMSDLFEERKTGSHRRDEAHSTSPPNQDRKLLAKQRDKLLKTGRETERQRRLARSGDREAPDLTPPDPDLDGR